MVLCFVPDCNHYSDKENKGCKMFRFPDKYKDPDRRKSWLKLIRRGDRSPSYNSRICSCHFKDGNKKNLPEIFKRNEVKRSLFLSEKTEGETKAKKKEILRSKNNVVAEKNVLIVDEEQEQLGDKLRCIENEDLTSDKGLGKELQHSEQEELNKEVSLEEIVEIRSIPENKILDTSFSSCKEFEHTEKEECFNEEISNLQKEIVFLKTSLKHKGIEIEEKSAEIVMLKKSLEDADHDIKRLKEVLKIATTKLNANRIIYDSEVQNLKKVIDDEKEKNSSFYFDNVKNHVGHYTGLPNKETFYVLLSIFENRELQYHMGWKVECLTKEQQLLMTLMKLRRNFSHIDLAMRFGVSTGTVSNVVLTWVEVLHYILVVQGMAKIPSRYKNRASMPKSFASYASCRIVLDCTEVFAANPKKLSFANAMYSSYKHRITLKGLVGIAPNGTVTFLSKLYPGSTSDKNIVHDSGVLDQLVSGDYIMADKGFLIGDILPPGVYLNIPPFLSGPQFTPAQVAATLSIAQARIHVERAIQRIKLFHILDFLPANYILFASKIFRVCGALTNLMNPLISEVADQMMFDNDLEEEEEEEEEDEEEEGEGEGENGK